MDCLKRYLPLGNDVREGLVGDLEVDGLARELDFELPHVDAFDPGLEHVAFFVFEGEVLLGVLVQDVIRGYACAHAVVHNFHR